MATILQLAGMLPRDPYFRLWAHSFCECPIGEEEAAQFIRLVCEVTSRRELITNPEAEQRFHRFIRKPFLLWKERNLENAA